MARKKVRNYPSIEDYEKQFDEYFKEHYNDVVDYVLKETGYSSLEKLRFAEQNMAFGLDCGWVYLCPRNTEMEHEWILDNDKYSAKVYLRDPMRTQSVTIKRLCAEKLIEDLGLENIFYISERLD